MQSTSRSFNKLVRAVLSDKKQEEIPNVRILFPLLLTIILNEQMPSRDRGLTWTKLPLSPTENIFQTTKGSNMCNFHEEDGFFASFIFY